MKSDFAKLILAALNGKLDEYEIEWDEAPAVCVVMTAKGYPGTPETGDKITGIKEAEKTGAIISLAGVKFDKDDNLVTAGGRVLDVTGKGNHAGDFYGAMLNAYSAVKEIDFDGRHYRTDIANRAINR
jgi:phosphoribosylamine--glycine ligase